MSTRAQATTPMVSEMAASLSGSEIIKLAGEINARKAKGEHIHNLTIGDFDPGIFPIPELLNQYITEAYGDNQTNYPPANGIAALRTELSHFHKDFQGLDYHENTFLVAGGARPLIYALYQTLLNPGDKVIFPVPSWNNNHYCHLSDAEQIAVETQPQQSFMPGRADIEPYIKDASLITLCSPLNPTGTVFAEDQLREICELVIEENNRRGPETKPVYIMYDQIYWTLTYGVDHIDPVSLFPELRPYTIFIDGLSKAFAATGVRVGWAFGPEHVIDKMKSILGHVGAWAPKAEQVATARYLSDHENVKTWLTTFRKKLSFRLEAFYAGFLKLKEKGYQVDAIPPAAAIYLTVQFDLTGYKPPKGNLIQSPRDTTAFLLEVAGVAIVPFYAFGADDNSTWYRLSVGTVKEDDINSILEQLEHALAGLTKSNG